MRSAHSRRAAGMPLPPEGKHWHGARADCRFSRLAAEVPDGDCSNQRCEAANPQACAARREDGGGKPRKSRSGISLASFRKMSYNNVYGRNPFAVSSRGGGRAIP